MYQATVFFYVFYFYASLKAPEKWRSSAGGPAPIYSLRWALYTFGYWNLSLSLEPDFHHGTFAPSGRREEDDPLMRDGMRSTFCAWPGHRWWGLFDSQDSPCSAPVSITFILLDKLSAHCFSPSAAETGHYPYPPSPKPLTSNFIINYWLGWCSAKWVCLPPSISPLPHPPKEIDGKIALLLIMSTVALSFVWYSYGPCLPVFGLLPMDPRANVPEYLSQKTSPATDPAELQQQSSELSAQLTVLASHQQLNPLTSLTEELVRTPQGLWMSPAVMPSQAPAPTAVATMPSGPPLLPTRI